MSKKGSKILLHILVWLTIFEIETIIYWKWNLWGITDLDTAIIYNISINIVKIIGTYVFILLLVPFLMKNNLDKRVNKLIILLYLIVWLLIYRVEINFVTWPLIFGNFPGFNPFDFELSLYSFIKIITPLPFLLLINGYFEQLKKEDIIKQLEREKTKAELKYLKAQTNPHFLFNTLNNIYVLARNKSELTAPSLAKLSKLLRFMLYESDQPSILLAKEVELINNYIELEKLRYNDRLNVDFTTDIDNKMKNIPPFFLLPFVENAFKHGASQSTGNIKIIISIKLTNNLIQFKCSNPITKNQVSSTSGIGIKNIKRRLELIFPENYELIIDKINNVFSVNLKIEL